MIRGTCTVQGCDRPHKARGYCQTHYMQFKRGEPIVAEIKVRVRVKPESCETEGCNEPVKAKGLCKTHYQRLLRHGHTKYTDRKRPPKICAIPACDNHLYAKGLCHAHYVKERTWRAFGLTAQGYVNMLEAQKGRCLICEKVETVTNGPSGKLRDMAIDHCHTTGKIRGLLCSACNTGIGLLQDDPALLDKAAAYLRSQGV